jgi:tetratricopeptide (TPR) repeat protein
VRYCSRKCQKDDWKVHKNNCYDIDSDDNNKFLMGKALNYFNQGMYDKAEEKYIKLYNNSKITYGYTHPHTLLIMEALANTYQKQDKFNQAQELYNECLLKNKINFSILDEYDTINIKKLESINLSVTANLAFTTLCQGKLNEAEILLTQCLEEYSLNISNNIDKNSINNDNDNITNENNNNNNNRNNNSGVIDVVTFLTDTYLSAGRYADAETLLLKWIEIEKQQIDVTIPSPASISNGTTSTTTTTEMILKSKYYELLCSLGNTYRLQKRYDAARVILQECLNKFRCYVGDNHLSTINVEINLGQLYVDIEDYVEGEKLLKNCLNRATLIMSKEHSVSLTIKEVLVDIYLKLGKNDNEIELLMDSCIKNSRKIYGDYHQNTIKIINTQCSYLIRIGNYTDAEIKLKKCYQNCMLTFGNDHELTLSILCNYASIYRYLHEYDKAQELCGKIIFEMFEI